MEAVYRGNTVSVLDWSKREVRLSHILYYFMHIVSYNIALQLSYYNARILCLFVREFLRQFARDQRQTLQSSSAAPVECPKGVNVGVSF